MQTISFNIDMVPVAKGRARTRVIGGKYAIHYTPKKTAMAENEILRQAIPHKPSTPLQKWAKISLKFFMPIPASFSKKDRSRAISGELRHTKKPDIDNLVKTIDALNGVFWKDDAIIIAINASKAYHQSPGIEVFIEGE
jgi:Holliday junction resolvase RusA-like endonuclease